MISSQKDVPDLEMGLAPSEEIEQNVAPQQIDTTVQKQQQDTEMLTASEEHSLEPNSATVKKPDAVKQEAKFEVMALKDTKRHKVSMVDDYTESQMFQFEDKNLTPQELEELPLLQRLAKLAESIVALLKAKHETVSMFSTFN